jgi:D-sedoheptulose 7-phosphate isomerase
MINMKKDYFQVYFEYAAEVIKKLDKKEVEKTLNYLLKIKNRKGRLFLLGVGGSAANCTHAVNDFHKICHIEAYTPVDNVSELTAWTNDNGWQSVFVEWLKISRLNKRDGVLVYSVGGGNLEKNISANIVEALKFAKKVKATILGIASRDGGYTKKVADSCILVPVIHKDFITPLAESFQVVIWHAIVTHPKLREVEPY